MERPESRSPRWSFRPMRQKDIPEVMVVERLCFQDPWDKGAFVRETINSFSRSLLARDEQGRLVGYAMWWVAGPEYHLLNLAVHPRVRRQGLARALMNRMIAEARQDHADFIALEVRVSNVPAKTLYQRLGFRTVGVRPRYYQDGEDADVMLLRLDPTL